MRTETYEPCQIHIGNFTWQMNINLNQICRRTGRKIPELGAIGYTVAECKKLLRLIFQYADGENLQKASDYIDHQPNQKVKDIWNKINY